MVLTLERPRVRDARVLGRQMAQLEAFYRLGLVGHRRTGDGDLEPWLEAATGAGMSWVLAAGSHRSGGHAQTEARFAPLVQAAVDSFPAHVVQYAPRALTLLRPELQLVLRATLVYGMSQQACVEAFTAHYGDSVPISLRTVQRWKTQALEQLAKMLWNERGEQAVPEGLK